MSGPKPKVKGEWGNHFTVRLGEGEEGWRVFCNQSGCESDFSPLTASSNLQYHISNEHRGVYEAHKAKKRKHATPLLIQPTLGDMKLPKKAQAQIDRRALEWIIDDMLPFSVMDSPSFRAFVKSVNPRATPPCGATVRARLIDYKHDVFDLLRRRIEAEMGTGAITFDGWSSISNKPFLGITLHWLDPDFTMRECVLAMAPFPYPHNAVRHAEVVRKTLNDWNLWKKIGSATTDSAPVMGAAMRNMRIMVHIPCVAHALHNCVKASLAKAKLQSLVDKCHNLAIFFHSSPKMAQLLDQDQGQNNGGKPLKVILDVATRWNSTFHMLERLLQLKPCFDSVGVVMEEEDAARLRATTPRENEWEQLKAAIKLLQPFESLTRLFSSSTQGMAAMIVPRTAGLLGELEAVSVESDTLDNRQQDALSKFKDALIEQVEARIFKIDYLAIATAFHPAFNNLWIFNDEHYRTRRLAELREEFNGIASNFYEPSQQSQADNNSSAGDVEETALQKLLKRRRSEMDSEDDDDEDNELDQYLRLKVYDVELDPVQWWKEHQGTFPALASLARKYLAIPASSVASERMFSYSGNISTEKRNRLSDDVVGDIVFCNYGRKALQSMNITVPLERV